MIVLFIVITSIARAADSELRDLIVQNHIEYLPTRQGSFPTLIAIPGCSGISSSNPATDAANPDLREDDLLFRRHYRSMAEKFRDQGFAVLLIDIHTAEGLLTACGGGLKSERIAEYINETVTWAKSLPFVDTTQIHVIGWSMGGGGVLAWLHGPRSAADAVSSVVVVYPGCNESKPLNISKPILMLLGGADDIAIPSVCEDLAKISPVRRLIVLRTYPNARHGYDIPDAPPMLDIGNGMSVGYQKEAAEASWQQILTFLSASQ